MADDSRPLRTPRLTREMIAQSRVIAKGQAIREVDRLVRQYGGRAARWAKKSSPLFVRSGRRFEYHWYEQHGIGRREIRLKEVP